MPGERLYSEFKDDKGTDWRVSIYDTNGTWNPANKASFKLGSEGFVISYTGNNEQQHQPIIGSSVEFTLYEENSDHTNTLNLLYSFAEGRLLLEVYRDPDGDNDIYWRGVILAEQVERADEPFPTAVRLTASDDLGNMKDVTFTRSLLPTVGTTVLSDVLRCLSVLRTNELYNTTETLVRYINDTELSASSDDSDPLNTITASVPQKMSSTGAAENYSCFEILHSLATCFNARVFQAEGVWWFWPINVHQRVSDSEVLGSVVKQYDKEKTAVTFTAADQIAFNNAIGQESGTDYTKLAGHVFTHLPPIESVLRTRRTSGNIYIVSGYDDTVVTSGNNITLADEDRTYEVGTKLQVSGQILFNVSGDSGFDFGLPASRVNVELEIMLNVDAKYYQPEEWTTDSSDRYVITLQQFDRSNGCNINSMYSFITDALPSEEDGLDVTAVVKFYNLEGTNVTSSYTSEDFYLFLAVTYVDGDTGNPDSIVFRADSNSENVLVVDQGVILHGDRNNFSSQGVFIDSNKEWKTSQTTGPLPIHRLGVNETLARQRFATKIHRGTVYGLVEMWHTMIEDSEYYVPFELSTVMNTRETSVERYKIAYDSSGITYADDEVRREQNRGDLVDFVNATANTITSQVQQPKLESGSGPVSPTGGRAIALSDLQGPVFHRVTQIDHTAGSTYTIQNDDFGYMYTNSYTDSANGFGTIYLPKVGNNEGRMLRFKTDSTLHANKYIVLALNTDEETAGVRIDGATSYTMDRDYDGIGVLCHGGQWFIIQKKEKGGGAVQELDGELLEFITRDSAYANNTYEGQVVKYGSDTLVAGKFYVYASSGWAEADADAENQTRGLIGLALGTDSGTDGVLIRGIYASTTYSSFTAGQMIYLSTTSGTVTTTAPTASGDFVRVIGYALGSNYIVIDPSPNYIEL